ncbi:MAG: myo-inositol-1(or 4)-monophosphatase [Oceanospirillaceae bacterium]|jgi:myo-inositol-1(or 4)-monophosphatase
MKLNLAECGDVAINVAKMAGELAQQQRNQGLSIDAKGIQDFVTQADVAVEQLIKTQLLKHYPTDSVFGEELGKGVDEGASADISKELVNQASDLTWVIDPIDGTTNYMKGMDYWCISIALVRNNEILLGCVFAPDKNEMYLALKDQGATLNGKTLSNLLDVSADKVVLGIGRSNRSSFKQYIATIEYLYAQQIDYRRFGSAALTLAQIANGEIDGYYEAHLNSWDACAGWLIAAEAGASCSEFLSDGALENGNRVVVANSSIYAKLNAQLV